MKSHTLWTGARIKRLRELALASNGSKEIAQVINEEFGTNYSRKAVLSRARRSGIVISRPTPRPRKRGTKYWSAAEDQIAEHLLAKGATPVAVSHEIFDATGIFRSDLAVKARARLQGWERRDLSNRWTPKEDTKLRLLVARGLDILAIASSMRISKSRVQNRIWALGLLKIAPPKWTESDQRRLKDLASTNLSPAEISKRIGRSKRAVIGRAWRTGVELSKPGQRQ